MYLIQYAFPNIVLSDFTPFLRPGQDFQENHRKKSCEKFFKLFSKESNKQEGSCVYKTKSGGRGKEMVVPFS